MNESQEKEGEWTYNKERASSVIDYVTSKKRIKEIREIKGGERTERIESRTIPLEVIERKKRKNKDVFIIEKSVLKGSGTIS